MVSATEAARGQPARPHAPAHDALTRLLHHLEPDPDTLRAEVRPPLDPAAGALVVDDSTRDKPPRDPSPWSPHYWSGDHHAVVR